MADQPQPSAISAAFPAPPPFYKSFIPQNLERLQEHRETTSQSPSDIFSLPPELRNLVPPSPPAEGKYRSFGQLHDISPPSTTSQTTPTQSALQTHTQNLLLTFLSLTHVLATNPSAFGPKWDELHSLFQEIHKVINAYRPHQARETLILMMEEQVRKVRGETEMVGQSVERAREVVKGLGEGKEEVGMKEGRKDVDYGERESRRAKDGVGEKRVWEVVEREVGRF